MALTADSPTPSAEQALAALFVEGRDSAIPLSRGYSDEFVYGEEAAVELAQDIIGKLAEAGISLVPEATDTDLRERVASRIHWAIGGWIMGPWEQVTHEGQRNIVYRAADAAIAAGVKDGEQLTDGSLAHARYELETRDMLAPALWTDLPEAERENRRIAARQLLNEARRLAGESDG